MKRLVCDVCGRPYETLGMYGGADLGWWTCLGCFEKADRIAAKEDRWPNQQDFMKLKESRLGKVSGKISGKGKRGGAGK